MKKIPHEIRKTIKGFQRIGREAYLTGDSLTYLILDIGSPVWEISTNANSEEEKGVLTEFGGNIDVNINRYTGKVEDFLISRFFTMETAAFDGKDWIDPYHGREDIELECLRITKEPGSCFREEPLKMLIVARKVAECGFSVDEEIKLAMRTEADLIGTVDKDVVTELFSEIITASYAGKALRLLEQCGLLAVLVGKNIYHKRNRKEIAAFEKYMAHIDETLPIPERRIVSFFLGFWKNSGKRAMENMNFSEEIKRKFWFTNDHLSDLYYIHKAVDLKDYLYKYGLERYTFINDISKIQAKIYGLDTRAIGMRHRLLQNIASQNEPVFLEDLALNQQVLLEEKLAENERNAGEILDLLVYIVHRHPEYNEPVRLLSQAYKLKKNPLRREYLKYCSRKL